MKQDEKIFLMQVYTLVDPYTGEYENMRRLINSDEFTMHYKRAHYLLNKWQGKGWYDYGVALDLGWLTNKGKKVAKNLALEMLAEASGSPVMSFIKSAKSNTEVETNG